MDCQYIFDTLVEISHIGQGAAEMITPEQCRAARALLNWRQEELANEAGVGIVTVRQFEGAAHAPRRATLEVIRRALETAGVQFIEENGGGPGVRLRKKQQKKGSV
jgi:transcriptional regulator with XRE-family HTH domain